MPCNHDTIALSDATRATLVREIRKTATPPGFPSLLAMPLGYDPTPSLTEADVRRIVREELDARKPGPLDVSAADIRRYMGGARG